MKLIPQLQHQQSQLLYQASHSQAEGLMAQIVLDLKFIGEFLKEPFVSPATPPPFPVPSQETPLSVMVPFKLIPSIAFQMPQVIYGLYPMAGQDLQHPQA